MVGDEIGPFRIDKELGSGAMGTVYRAVYTQTNQRVALKFIAPGLLGNERALERFEREANILKQLRHPNITRLFATGRYKKTPFIAMEYVDGESVEQLLERRGHFTWEEVVRLGRQLCDALHHAHQKGIIHRDLKPSNLMLTRDGTLKLTDFGIAKDTDLGTLTGTNHTVGTASYMSPEQCKGVRQITIKSDLYSLGVVFYELLTGEKPFTAESPIEMFMAHVEGTFERPSRKVMDVPPWLDTLVCQLLEKKPEHRPFDAAMVGRALEEVTEKVAQQKSAGVEAATARAVDRHRPARPDDADREVARELRGAVLKKKIRKRGKPFYEHGAFVMVAVAAVMFGLIGTAYLLLKPPSPDQLAAQVRSLMDDRQHDKARDLARKFVTLYPHRADSDARQVREWHEQLEVELRERQLHNRYRRGMTADAGAEEICYAALRCEDDGDADDARARWTKVRDEPSADPVWGWLARKKLADLDQVPVLHRRMTEATDRPTLDPDRRAWDALKAEQVGDTVAARDAWRKLHDDYRHDPARRVWAVWAAVKLRAAPPTLPAVPKPTEP